MGQTLPNGIYLPAEGERNCYDGLEGNWRSLDGLISTVSGKASATHTHGNITTDGKLATADRVVITDSTKSFTTSNVTATELGYLSGVTSSIQTQLNAKATDSDVVHKAGNETIEGNKTWSDAGIYSKGNLRINTDYALGTLPVSEDAQTILTALTSDGNFAASITTYQSATRGTGLRLSIRNKWDNNNNLDPTGTSRNAHLEFLQTNGRIPYIAWSGFIDTGLYPLTNNTYDLGTSTYKWKTLNGINPGALSLPDYNNVLDVTSEIPIASLDGNTQININDYLPNKTGWLSIVVDDTAGNSIIATQGRPGGSTAYNNSRTFHTGTQSNGFISVFFPILADMNKFVSIKASSLIQMRFYYCLGNV